MYVILLAVRGRKTWRKLALRFHQGPFERWVDPPDVVTSAGNQAGFGDENIVYKQRDGRKHFLLYSTQHYRTCKSRQNIIDFKSAIMSAPQAGKEDYVDKVSMR